MRFDKDLHFFVRHFDWYTKDKEGFFVPTDKAPPDAVEAMKKCNARIKRDIDNNTHYI